MDELEPQAQSSTDRTSHALSLEELKLIVPTVAVGPPEFTDGEEDDADDADLVDLERASEESAGSVAHLDTDLPLSGAAPLVHPTRMASTSDHESINASDQPPNFPSRRPRRPPVNTEPVRSGLLPRSHSWSRSASRAFERSGFCASIAASREETNLIEPSASCHSDGESNGTGSSRVPFEAMLSPLRFHQSSEEGDLVEAHDAVNPPSTCVRSGGFASSSSGANDLRLNQATGPMSVGEIQARIRAISKDPSLSESEKNVQRQAILSQRFQERRKREAVTFSQRMELKRLEVSYSSVTDPETGEKMLGCEHYPRNCKLKADCCGLWVTCRLCHDDPNMDHAMDRFNTKEVMCMRCQRVQPVSNTCINESCKTSFARYFCEKCKFYDSTPGKNIYHCDKCKICRVGKGIGHDNFHCDRCDACVSREFSKSHRCLQKSLDADCPICGLYLFTSTKPVVFMRCGHTMHAHCFDSYTEEHYTCPLCHKALTNMRPHYEQIDEAVRQEVMPDEHRSKVAEVLCHDCDKRTITAFHFLYLKCMAPRCGSYNTRLLQTVNRDAAGPSTASGAEAGACDGEDSDEDMGCEPGSSNFSIQEG